MCLKIVHTLAERLVNDFTVTGLSICRSGAQTEHDRSQGEQTKNNIPIHIGALLKIEFI